jgi:hypothetical protein
MTQNIVEQRAYDEIIALVQRLGPFPSRSDEVFRRAVSVKAIEKYFANGGTRARSQSEAEKMFEDILEVRAQMLKEPPPPGEG